MDLYPKTSETLRRLLNKRQNPCTQIFKTQPLNPTNGPSSTMNLPRSCVTATQEERNLSFTAQDSTSLNNPINTAPYVIPQTTQSSIQGHTTSTESLASAEDDEEGEDSDDFELVQKKLKTKTVIPVNQKYSRRSSCEDDKEENHSTSCETYSELHPAHEASDFLLSPQHSFQTSKDPSELKLDEEEVLQKGVPNHATQAQEGVSELSSSQESAINSKLANSKQKVKCKINHQCEIDIQKNTCPRCDDLLSGCQEFALKNGGSCLNEVYDESIIYQCHKGHKWSLNHRNARRRWCAQCAKEERAFLKKKCEEEKVEREKQEEQCQQKLFEEAKKKAMKENPAQPNPFQGRDSSNHRAMSALEYFQRVDYEVETLAKKYTIEFMSQKEFAGNITYQQILQVYKILVMPEEILQSYMFSLNTDTLRSEFRRIAKIIHPDKNKHPQAGNAFQKVYRVYEVALSRLEGTQKKI